MPCPGRLQPAAIIFALAMFLTAQTGWSQQSPKSRSDAPASLPEMELPLAAVSPQIDGALDDPAWKSPPLPLGEWITYNPVYGNRTVQRTEVWGAYDQAGLYFAFNCTDPEPDKIKTAISRRDTIFNDDWVGISLDSLGSHQSTYELFVNPDGIQADILSSSTSGEDSSPDWVWESAARKTEHGYTVEIHVPFKTIRFASGAEVRMAILFSRRVSRLGVSASWPDLPPGASFFARHAPMILHDVKRPLTLELIPNVTYGLNQTRSAPERWKSDSDLDGGITAKYGISSTVTLDGTYRPDFSQVESDAFQVEVNQRYPLFYSEKRPFFMEGAGTFELAGVGGDANMRTAVHTRRIVDPLFGMKLTGTIGKVTLAALSSADRAPGNTEESDPLSGKKKYFNVARAHYSLGKGTYIGGLITDTELGSRGYNRVMAGDISLQFGAHHKVTATAITSGARNFDGSGEKNGMAGQAYYSYRTKRQILSTQFEHYDKDFEMETAFYNRTGITTNWTYYSYNLYPDESRYPWFKKFAPFVWARVGRDRIQGGNEHFVLGGIQLNFTRQGWFRVDYGAGKEPWAGRMFNTNQIRTMGNAQLFSWLYVFAYFCRRGTIYYDDPDPFSGNSRNFRVEGTFQPSHKLSQVLGYDRVVFHRASNGARVYTVDIINMKTTYQFNRHFFVRAIERYDSSRKHVMMDFLASYEPVPGTVAYVGHGTLFDREEWDGNEFNPGRGDYLNMQRSLFFKLSYLFRF